MYCAYRGQSKKGDTSVGDELPMDNKSKNKGREDKEVCTTSVGIETTISRLWNKATTINDTRISYTQLWLSSTDNECKCQILLLIYP